MKKLITLLLAMATVIGISTVNLTDGALGDNLAYAANEIGRVDDLDRDTSSFKAQFSYEMAKITERLVAVPNANVDTFKAEYSYAIARLTAKMLPIISGDQRNSFAYEMTQLTTRVVNAQNLDVENAKIEFSYTIAQITSKVINNADRIGLARMDAFPEQRGTSLIDDRPRDSKASANSGYIDQKTYASLVDDLKRVGTRGKNVDHKINLEGEARYHYAFTRGYKPWEGDGSGLRLRLGFNTDIDKDWKLLGMWELNKSFGNYYDSSDLARLYVAGKSGTTMLKVGKFDTTWAEGNIYDSSFTGVRAEIGDVVKYSAAVGKTYISTDTAAVTARYDDFDYNLEAGIYHYQMGRVNTIYQLGGNYKFSNLTAGAMYLVSSRKDVAGNNDGYVLGLTYGEVKSWRKGTFDVVAKFYSQPRYTYIAHGMNGMGNSLLMEGFRGYGYGVHYTFKENVVGGLEYYDLSDIFGRKARTLWGDITFYF